MNVVDKCCQHRLVIEPVSSDQVQMDALILTVELAYREILSTEHTEGLDYQRRKCQMIRNDHYHDYDAVECVTRG